MGSVSGVSENRGTDQTVSRLANAPTAHHEDDEDQFYMYELAATPDEGE